MNWKRRIAKAATVGLIIMGSLSAGRYLRSAVQEAPARAVVGETSDIYSLDEPADQLLLVARSDCPACRVISPVWEELAESAPTTTVVRHVTVTPDAGPGSTFDVKGVRYESATPTILRRAGIRAIPTTIVVDASGEITFRRVGPLTPSDLIALKGLLD